MRSEKREIGSVRKTTVFKLFILNNCFYQILTLIKDICKKNYSKTSKNDAKTTQKRCKTNVMFYYDKDIAKFKKSQF